MTACLHDAPNDRLQPDLQSVSVGEQSSSVEKAAQEGDWQRVDPNARRNRFGDSNERREGHGDS
jgi:hypothetical protein